MPVRELTDADDDDEDVADDPKSTGMPFSSLYKKAFLFYDKNNMGILKFYFFKRFIDIPAFLYKRIHYFNSSL